MTDRLYGCIWLYAWATGHEVIRAFSSPAPATNTGPNVLPLPSQKSSTAKAGTGHHPFFCTKGNHHAHHTGPCHRAHGL